MKPEFSQQIFEKSSNFMKIYSVEAQLLRADRHAEANSGLE